MLRKRRGTALSQRIIAIAFVVSVFSVLSQDGQASATLPLQTLNMIAGNTDSQHPVGSADPNTDVSIDNGQTWTPAILAGGHPYQESPGTNSWLNCVSITQNAEDSCRANVSNVNPVRALFRHRFWLASDFYGANLLGDINIDNFAVFYLNGTTQQHCFMGCTSQGGPIADFYGQVRNLQAMFGVITLDSYLVSGWNTLYIELIDTGGQSGINYNVTLSVYSGTPIGVALPGSIVTFDAQGGTVQTLTSTVTPGSTLSTITFPTPTRQGYQFLGWRTAPSGGVLADASYRAATTPTSDLTVYAEWVASPVTSSSNNTSLANTGSERDTMLVFMVLSLLLGSAMLMLSRRRKAV